MSDVTTDDDVRYKYLASIVTGLLFLSLCLLVVGASAGVLALGAVSQPWFLLYSAVLTASAGWLFGKEFVNWKNGQ